MIAFICLAIAFFASTWGPTAWVVIGETFPLPIRSRGVGLSTASNWLWNCILAVISPYFVGEKYGNLGAKVSDIKNNSFFPPTAYKLLGLLYLGWLVHMRLRLRLLPCS
jgi:hypothetical protein